MQTLEKELHKTQNRDYTMIKTKLAVSGEKGSFSEEAGLIYIGRMGLDAELIFALDMEGVLSRVENGEVELGIFPVVNSRGGLVQTAFEAMGRHLFHKIDEVWLDVHQCLIVNPGIDAAHITKIVSHPQAISQCERYLAKEFPGIPCIEWEDTAKAAKDLAEGVLEKSVAVIAPSRSAQMYNLTVLAHGIQDNHPNLTTFIVVRKRS